MKKGLKDVVSPKLPQYPGAILSNSDFQVRWEIIANLEPLGQLQEFATKPKESRRMLPGTCLEDLMMSSAVPNTTTTMVFSVSVSNLTVFISSI